MSDMDFVQGTNPMTQRADSGDRQYAMLMHLSALACLLFLGGLAFLGPLIMWLIKKEDSAFIDAQGKAAVNFHLSMLLWVLICVVLIFTIVGIIIAVPALIVLAILQIVMIIVVAIQSSNGQDANYPLSIRFLS